MIGQQTVVNSPVLSEKPAVAKLIDVEEGGIWVEYQGFIEGFLEANKLSHSPKTPVIFVPYAQILWILGTEDYPALSEKSFGLDKP